MSPLLLLICYSARTHALFGYPNSLTPEGEVQAGFWLVPEALFDVFKRQRYEFNPTLAYVF